MMAKVEAKKTNQVKRRRNLCTLCRHISHVYDEKVGGNIGKEMAATVAED